jgi:AcrR family transcriptional regulator
MAAPRRPRGRPRSEKAQQAILDAATALLIEHGLDAVSMDELADLAGVSKATVYRWWPSKHVLALDVLAADWSAIRPAPRDTGTLRGDLRSILRPWVRVLPSRPYGAVIAALFAEAQMNPEFHALWRARFVDERREPAELALARAKERGEIPKGTDAELVLDLLYGAIYHRLLHGRGPMNDRVANTAIDIVLLGIAD